MAGPKYLPLLFRNINVNAKAHIKNSLKVFHPGMNLFHYRRISAAVMNAAPDSKQSEKSLSVMNSGILRPGAKW